MLLIFSILELEPPLVITSVDIRTSTFIHSLHSHPEKIFIINHLTFAIPSNLNSINNVSGKSMYT